jgi:hypothetical protein
MFNTCAAASCDAQVSGTLDCKGGTTCNAHFSGSGFCGNCGPNATCDFTDDSSAGGQQYTCDVGSKCAVHITASSGGRTVTCPQAASCNVDGSVSGYSLVQCANHCTVDIFGGFVEVCCPNQMPTTCPSGKISCDPADC